MTRLSQWYQRLSTAGKLLLLLSAAILPLGLVLVFAATSGIDKANQALVARAADQGRLAIRSVDSLIFRNVLALRVAANGALDGSGGDPCERAELAMSVAPDIPRSFVLRDRVGTQLCSRGEVDTGERPTLLVDPGKVRLWISPAKNSIYFRVGLLRGSVTGAIDRQQLQTALGLAHAGTDNVTLSDGNSEISVRDPSAVPETRLERATHTIEGSFSGGQLAARARVSTERVKSVDRLIILLPVLMWIVATSLSWLVVRTFLLGPLKRMSRAIAAHEPGSGALNLPDRQGSAVEIRELGQSFARAVERIERSEKDMAEALEGQRKLVREVHHRVKNNLQVVASLLNIHRRSAASDEAKDAYSSIGRRVDALAVVHRNHYAELEENRGIALRPLLSELAANLRGSAPESARMLDIGLDLESLNTTQDVAVATAFLTTEIVEHAMLADPGAPVTLSLHRTGDLTARFTLATGVLTDDVAGKPEHQQFERIVAGLAKQLRSSLDKAPGRYSVDLPVFPPRQ